MIVSASYPPPACARGTRTPYPLPASSAGRRWRKRSECRVSGAHIAGTCVQVFVLGFCLSACGVNNIPKLQEIARAKWFDLLYAYSSRDDGTRELIAAVQRHAGEERTGLEDLIKSRARAHETQVYIATEVLTQRGSFEQFAQAQDELAAALSRLVMACERDRDLKSDQSFVRAAAQLEDSKNRIAAAQREYDEAAEQYNKELRTLPGAFWGATLYHNNRPMQTFGD